MDGGARGGAPGTGSATARATAAAGLFAYDIRSRVLFKEVSAEFVPDRSVLSFIQAKATAAIAVAGAPAPTTSTAAPTAAPQGQGNEEETPPQGQEKGDKGNEEEMAALQAEIAACGARAVRLKKEVGLG